MAERPNVLLICTDHWPGGLFGAAGHPAIQTPTLDQIIRNGVRFNRAYSETPVCGPARRTLMTGAPPRVHGDRTFCDPPMAPIPTMAQTFRNAGYQAYAVGKLHVFPQRNRIGFDEVILDEECRNASGLVDDYEIFLGDRGYAGRQFDHGMSNNEYSYRPWQLPDDCHVTNWATTQMGRFIRRRDPTRPAFWYISYRHPHPPLVPLRTYLDMYDDVEIDQPYCGEWALDREKLPFALRSDRDVQLNATQIRAARKAFYALCTHVDHQLRLLIGTLREEGILNNTILMFTADHGDMLGNHGQWAKCKYYEGAAQIPMILNGVANDPRVGHHRTDDRLVGLQDVMPTLLDLAGIETPSSCTGISMVGEKKRPHLFGEYQEGDSATRMIHNGRYKLIYYPCGNRSQLFDLQDDPRELNDLSTSKTHAAVLQQLQQTLVGEFYGSDEKWLQNGKLVGSPDKPAGPKVNRALSNQRGIHWPPPPVTAKRM